MLDLHANLTTPGLVLVGGIGPGVVAAGDGQTNPGVPLDDNAELIAFGFLAPTADSISRIKLSSTDLPDPTNGIQNAPGATSLILGTFQYAKVPYKGGQRVLTASTNVGVVAGTGLLLDNYPGNCVMGNRAGVNMVGQEVATTFGAALVANTWGAMAWAPANPLPAGKYAILGAYCSAITNVAAIRFRHNSFGGKTPGFPVVNSNLSCILGIQLCDKNPIWFDSGYQFVSIGEMLGIPSCPVFTVTNQGTGLTIEMIAAQACTPVVSLLLAKVG